MEDFNKTLKDLRQKYGNFNSHEKNAVIETLKTFIHNLEDCSSGSLTIASKAVDNNLDHSPLKLTIKKNTNQGPAFSCKECYKKFNSMKKMICHIISAHEKAEVTCKTCLGTFHSYSLLVIHECINSRQTTFVKRKCGVCDQLYVHKKDYESHMKEDHNVQISKCIKMFACSYCPATFKLRSQVLVHESHRHKQVSKENSGYASSLQKQMKNRSKVFCSVCKQSFLSQKALEKHKFTFNHKSKSGELEILKEYHCDSCNKSFSRIYTLQRHLSSHHNDYMHRCTICDYRTSEKCNLTEHMRRHYQIRDFICEFCNATFVAKRELKDHISFKHSSIRSFECTECGKMFKTRRILTRHIKTHLDVRPCVCACGASFVRLTNLRRHVVRVHHDPNPVVTRVTINTTTTNDNKKNKSIKQRSNKSSLDNSVPATFWFADSECVEVKLMNLESVRDKINLSRSNINDTIAKLCSTNKFDNCMNDNDDDDDDDDAEDENIGDDDDNDNDDDDDDENIGTKHLSTVDSKENDDIGNDDDDDDDNRDEYEDDEDIDELPVVHSMDSADLQVNMDSIDGDLHVSLETDDEVTGAVGDEDDVRCAVGGAHSTTTTTVTATANINMGEVGNNGTAGASGGGVVVSNCGILSSRCGGLGDARSEGVDDGDVVATLKRVAVPPTSLGEHSMSICDLVTSPGPTEKSDVEVGASVSDLGSYKVDSIIMEQNSRIWRPIDPAAVATRGGMVIQSSLPHHHHHHHQHHTHQQNSPGLISSFTEVFLTNGMGDDASGNRDCVNSTGSSNLRESSANILSLPPPPLSTSNANYLYYSEQQQQQQQQQQQAAQPTNNPTYIQHHTPHPYTGTGANVTNILDFPHHQYEYSHYHTSNPFISEHSYSKYTSGGSVAASVAGAAVTTVPATGSIGSVTASSSGGGTDNCEYQLHHQHHHHTHATENSINNVLFNNHSDTSPSNQHQQHYHWLPTQVVASTSPYNDYTSQQQHHHQHHHHHQSNIAMIEYKSSTSHPHQNHQSIIMHSTPGTSSCSHQSQLSAQRVLSPIDFLVSDPVFGVNMKSDFCFQPDLSVHIADNPLMSEYCTGQSQYPSNNGPMSSKNFSVVNLIGTNCVNHQPSTNKDADELLYSETDDNTV